MPLFIMISGMNYKWKSIYESIYPILVPFLIYNIMYESFYFIINGMPSSYVTSLSPMWIMWFLLSLISWRLITPYLVKIKYPVTLSIGLMLSSFLIDVFGYEFSLLRTFTFLPFFVVGYVYKAQILTMVNSKMITKVARLSVVPLFVLLSLINIDIGILKGGSNYVDLNMDISIALIHKMTWFCIAMLTSFIVLFSMIGRNSLFTNLSTKTLNVYLIHGFIVKALAVVLVTFTSNMMIPIMLIISIIITVILSSRNIDMANKLLFSTTKMYK